MKSVLASAACLPLLAACASHAEWHAEEAQSAEMIEVSVDSNGRPLETEFHVSPDEVPAVVREAMDRLHPGGSATGAEKEYVGSSLYWEITKSVDGREVEAMFHPDGTLHSQELEVAADAVPDAVRSAVADTKLGDVTKWEEIRDAEGALVEYHVKLSSAGKNYKLRVAAAGTVLAVLREVPAEIEIPIE